MKITYLERNRTIKMVLKVLIRSLFSDHIIEAEDWISIRLMLEFTLLVQLSLLIMTQHKTKNKYPMLNDTFFLTTGYNR
jgi:uncharacterized protein YqgQ